MRRDAKKELTLLARYSAFFKQVQVSLQVYDKAMHCSVLVLVQLVSAVTTYFLRKALITTFNKHLKKNISNIGKPSKKEEKVWSFPYLS